MSSIYDLNHPPNTFWDNLARSFEQAQQGPFFAPPGRRCRHPGPHAQSNMNQNEDTINKEESHANEEATAATSTQADDFEKKETDNTSSAPRCRGRRHPGPHRRFFTNNQNEGSANRPEEESRANETTSDSTAGPSAHADDTEKNDGSDEKGCRRCENAKHTGRRHPGPRRGKCGMGHRGFGGRGWNRPPFACGPAGVPPFEFLRELGTQLGIGVPFNNNTTPQDGADFVPIVDVFDTPTNYLLHVSLPGAKKEDLSIDYDIDESVLRLAGVVYRPGINEDLHQALVMEERRREVGVFERKVRLGTRSAPAGVVVDGITATLVDGVLCITIPKMEEEVSKKKVVVEDGSDEKMSVDETEEESETVTPHDSEAEDEGKEYVKVAVQ